MADIVFYPAPVSVLQKIDQRTESLERPIVRVLGTYVIPAGDVTLSQKIRLNALLKRLTVLVPAIGTKKVEVKIIDELGATAYTLANLPVGANFSGTNIDVPVAGNITVQVTLSGAQASDTTIYLFIYGE